MLPVFWLNDWNISNENNNPQTAIKEEPEQVLDKNIQANI